MKMRGGWVWCAVALPVFLARPGHSLAEDSSLETARRNYEVFCVNCHGESGKGDGPSAAALNPKPRDFGDCAGMRKRSDDELFKVISQGGESMGMSADMQPWGGTLSSDEIRGLVRFVRSFCKEPAAPQK